MRKRPLIEPGRPARLEPGTAQDTHIDYVFPAGLPFEPPVRPVRLRVVSGIEGDVVDTGGVIATLRITFLGGPAHELQLRGGTDIFEIAARPQVENWSIHTAFLRGGPTVLIHEIVFEPLPASTYHAG